MAIELESVTAERVLLARYGFLPNEAENRRLGATYSGAYRCYYNQAANLSVYCFDTTTGKSSVFSRTATYSEANRIGDSPIGKLESVLQALQQETVL